jgi:hypothetical protein
MRITATATILIREFRFIFDDRPDNTNPPAVTQRFDGPGAFSTSAQHVFPTGRDTYKVTVRAEPADRSPVVTADTTVDF